ncbi:WYL domain-containing protein [Mucilaginibacter sp. 21P]|uniref:helix-turn-helix transcriptional regulator n=1 Tax=Mucilaginibacter sp. 21P TaxID=2778902 RepID=UPI001C57348F|nr:WYL domain-containing protein [Mucilaginibacter sp. 21P]QXV66319.1 WYL domain-containing protein [Mucilaginibacter sp. 21P]
MAVNKAALIRYKILDRCFRNPGKKYFIEDLIEECNKQLSEIDPETKGIQRRQILYDIRYMESAEGWSAEIDRIPFGKKKHFRYRDINFSIDNQPLNFAEIEQLSAAVEILSRFKGLPQFEWVNEFAPKLEQSLTVESDNPIIGLDGNEYLKGVEYISPLFHAVLNKKVVSISYQSYKSVAPGEFIIHPYHLKQYNNRWFLFGHNEKLKKLTNLALDRIVSIGTCDVPYHDNDKYNFNEYFEDIIGVTRPDGGVVEKILLKFNEPTLPYILSKPLHGSQKTVKAKDEMLISIEVMHNFELESVLLSFGDRVKIISPQHLQDKINQRLQQAATHYKD